MIFELTIRINPRLIVMVILALHSLEVGTGEKRLSPVFYFLLAISKPFVSSQKHKVSKKQ
jgi:hypothetical protein